MKKITKEEANLVKGGAISTSALNAISRMLSTLYTLGQAVGSSIKRTWNKNYCR